MPGFSTNSSSPPSQHTHAAATLISAGQTCCWMELKRQLKQPLSLPFSSILTWCLSPASPPLACLSLLHPSQPNWPSVVFPFLLSLPPALIPPSFIFSLHFHVSSSPRSLLPLPFAVLPSNPCSSLLPWWRADLED